MIKEETQPPKPRLIVRWCRVKISKFKCESNCRLRINWRCNRLRSHFIFSQFHGLLKKLQSVTISPCLPLLYVLICVIVIPHIHTMAKMRNAFFLLMKRIFNLSQHNISISTQKLKLHVNNGSNFP